MSTHIFNTKFEVGEKAYVKSLVGYYDVEIIRVEYTITKAGVKLSYLYHPFTDSNEIKHASDGEILTKEEVELLRQ